MSRQHLASSVSVSEPCRSIEVATRKPGGNGISRRLQEVISKSSRRHQVVISRPSRRPQQTIKTSSGGHQDAISKPSRLPQEAIKKSSASHQDVLGRPSRRPQQAIKTSSAGHVVKANRSSDGPIRSYNQRRATRGDLVERVVKRERNRDGRQSARLDVERREGAVEVERVIHVHLRAVVPNGPQLQRRRLRVQLAAADHWPCSRLPMP